MVSRTALHMREDMYIREAEVKLIEFYKKYPMEVVEILSYSGENSFINDVAIYLETRGSINIRQLRAVMPAIRRDNRGRGLKTACLARKNSRVAALEREVTRLTNYQPSPEINPGSLTNQELINVYLGSDNPVIHVLANRLAIELDNPIDGE